MSLEFTIDYSNNGSDALTIRKQRWWNNVKCVHY